MGCCLSFRLFLSYNAESYKSSKYLNGGLMIKNFSLLYGSLLVLQIIFVLQYSTVSYKSSKYLNGGVVKNHHKKCQAGPETSQCFRVNFFVSVSSWLLRCFFATITSSKKINSDGGDQGNFNFIRIIF